MWAARDRIGLMFYKYKPIRDKDGIWFSSLEGDDFLMDFEEPGTFPFITMEAEEPTELQVSTGTELEVMLGWLEEAQKDYSGRTIDNIIENLKSRVKWQREHLSSSPS